MRESQGSPLGNAQAVMALAKRLAECKQIAELTDGQHDEPSTLALALADLATASEGYLRHVPALADPTVEGEELIVRLIEVTSQLQHMLFHLEDPRFFRKFLEPLRDEWESARSSGTTA